MLNAELTRNGHETTIISTSRAEPQSPYQRPNQSEPTAQPKDDQLCSSNSEEKKKKRN